MKLGDGRLGGGAGEALQVSHFALGWQHARPSLQEGKGARAQSAICAQSCGPRAAELASRTRPAPTADYNGCPGESAAGKTGDAGKLATPLVMCQSGSLSHSGKYVELSTERATINHQLEMADKTGVRAGGKEGPHTHALCVGTRPFLGKPRKGRVPEIWCLVCD